MVSSVGRTSDITSEVEPDVDSRADWSSTVSNSGGPDSSGPVELLINFYLEAVGQKAQHRFYLYVLRESSVHKGSPLYWST